MSVGGLVQSLYDKISELEAERNDLARQLGEEVARNQEWQTKWTLAVARADAAELKIAELERRLAEKSK